MRNYKGNTLLIELVIVLLFFSLSQVAIMQVFAASHQTAAQSRVTQAAMTAAQDAAERLSLESDPEAALTSMGFTLTGEQYVKSDGAGFELRATVTAQPCEAGTLHKTTLSAYYRNETLFTLPVACYRGDAQ